MRPQKYDLIFISTCTTLEHIHNLLYSIANNNKCLKVCGVILFQCGLDTTDVVYDTSNSIFIRLKHDKLCSLSKARNIGIGYVRECGLVSSYVMFPDDDSTFSKEFFDDFKKEVYSDTLINVFCVGTKNLYQKMPPLKYLEKTSNYLNAMSVNMIIQYNHFIETGFFDEKMGVGAEYGAGEDGDFFLRVCERFGPFTFNQHLYTFHPDSQVKYAAIPLNLLISRYKKYGEGVIYLLYKHKKYKEALSCVAKGLLGAFKALLVDWNGKLCLARIAGFYYRGRMLLSLLSTQFRS